MDKAAAVLAQGLPEIFSRAFISLQSICAEKNKWWAEKIIFEALRQIEAGPEKIKTEAEDEIR